MIRLHEIEKTFYSGKTAVNALKGINLQIQQGEFIALAGPSGSGKSTLLNIIGGLDKPTKGEVLINNLRISKFNDEKLSKYRNQTIGFVFQEFYLESALTVKENILLPTYFNRKAKKQKNFSEELIQEVKLKDKTNAKIQELSGGQKQRVALARALINRPKIILADEPTGNLDQLTGSKILKLLKNLHRKHQTTLIIATHDEMIARAANRIIHLRNGKIYA